MLVIFRRFGDIPAIAFVLFLLSIADMVWAETTCLIGDQSVGVTYGTADFVGGSWDHTWSDGSTVEVPGQDLEMDFGGGDTIRLRKDNRDPGAWADILTTLQRSLGSGPFTAVRLRDGSAFIINAECKRSWELVRNDPTAPIATDGTIVTGTELECLAEAGILTFERIAVDENGFRLDDPIRQTGGWGLSFGPGDYVVGVDTWGNLSSHNISDGVCGWSSISN